MKNKMQAQDNLTPAQQVAADFAAQFSNEDLQSIKNLDLAGLKNLLTAACESGVDYAIHVLPGRPDRPKKPTW